jgi:hypothetical protein
MVAGKHGRHTAARSPLCILGCAGNATIGHTEKLQIAKGQRTLAFHAKREVLGTNREPKIRNRNAAALLYDLKEKTPAFSILLKTLAFHSKSTTCEQSKIYKL